MPAQGCQLCRSRKVKCDRTRPSCQRCEKSGRKCPGVPDDNEIVFRNASMSNTQSATNPDIQADLQTASRLAASICDEFNQTLPLLPLQESEAKILLCFFLSLNRTSRFKNLNSRSMIAVMPIYLTSSVGSSLQAAMAAKALSFLGHFTGRDDIKRESARKYTQGLEIVRHALIHPNVSNDETIMAVSVLMDYESVTPSYESLDTYDNHIFGAVALIRQKELTSLVWADAKCLQAYRIVRNHVMRACVQSSLPTPTLLQGVDWFMDKRLLPDEFPQNSDLMQIAHDIIFLRSRAALYTEEIVPQNEMQLLQVLYDANQLDSQLSMWHTALPPVWLPQPTSWQAQENRRFDDVTMWPGVPQLYASMDVAVMFSSYRVLRILTQGIILKTHVQLAFLRDQDLEQSEETQHTFATMQQAVDEICASVPWHLSAVMRDKGSMELQRADIWAMETAGAAELIWPLFIALSVGSTPEEQRQWIRTVLLNQLAGKYGFQQARLLCARVGA